MPGFGAERLTATQLCRHRSGGSGDPEGLRRDTYSFRSTHSRPPLLLFVICPAVLRCSHDIAVGWPSCASLPVTPRSAFCTVAGWRRGGGGPWSPPGQMTRRRGPGQASCCSRSAGHQDFISHSRKSMSSARASPRTSVSDRSIVARMMDAAAPPPPAVRRSMGTVSQHEAGHAYIVQLSQVVQARPPPPQTGTHHRPRQLTGRGCGDEHGTTTSE